MERTQNTQTEMTQAAWSRLQALSCEHNARLYAAGRLALMTPRGIRGKQIAVDPEIQETVEILGRSDEAELKSRVLWYLTFHPQVFDACSARGWKLN